jgi:uncharacterized protein (DUF433 family)
MTTGSKSTRKNMMGKPVIRGTRIPVELIVRKVAEGADEQALLGAYPTLTAVDVEAALRWPSTGGRR